MLISLPLAHYQPFDLTPPATTHTHIGLFLFEALRERFTIPWMIDQDHSIMVESKSSSEIAFGWLDLLLSHVTPSTHDLCFGLWSDMQLFGLQRKEQAHHNLFYWIGARWI